MKTPEPLKAILFDLDGTLLDSFPAHFKAHQMAFERLGTTITKEEYLRFYSPNWYRTYEEMGLPRERWEEADRHWLEAAATLEPELFPGVPEILRQCASRMAVGLVTSGSKPRVQRDLLRTDIMRFFRVIITGDDVETPKPDPDGLHRAMKALNVIPEDTLFVGDAIADYEMAHAAGVSFLGIESEFTPKGEKLPFTPLKSVEGILPRLGI